MYTLERKRDKIKWGIILSMTLESYQILHFSLEKLISYFILSQYIIGALSSHFFKKKYKERR